jgi:muconolactone delta-isomerase
MEFLVVERHRESLTKDVLERVAPAMFDYLGKLERLGKAQHWVMAGQAGGVVLFDVESNEELATLISQSPIYPYTTREIIPLWDPSEAEGMLDQLISQMEALE